MPRMFVEERRRSWAQIIMCFTVCLVYREMSALSKIEFLSLVLGNMVNSQKNVLTH